MKPRTESEVRTPDGRLGFSFFFGLGFRFFELGFRE